MTDLRTTIAPKSDQINADDLIGGPMTIRVAAVSLCKEAEQPIAINFEGDNGKPYKPCKSMRRVLVSVWGPDGNAYAGRAMTIYRDDKVQFGGMAVGGIRISHMSNIQKDITMALTATRANRKPFTVKPLVMNAAPEPTSAPTDDLKDAVVASVDFFKTMPATAPNVARAEKESRTLIAECEEAGRADLKDMLVQSLSDARARISQEAA